MMQIWKEATSVIEKKLTTITRSPCNVNSNDLWLTIGNWASNKYAYSNEQNGTGKQNKQTNTKRTTKIRIIRAWVTEQWTMQASDCTVHVYDFFLICFSVIVVVSSSRRFVSIKTRCVKTCRGNEKEQRQLQIMAQLKLWTRLKASERFECERLLTNTQLLCFMLCFVVSLLRFFKTF